MLYTNKTLRFTASEIDAYRAQGLDVTQITTHGQFLQLLKENARRQRRAAKPKENKMTKRYGRRRIGGMMEYSNSYEELLQSQKRESAMIRDVFYGIVGLITGGIVAYLLMQRLHIDSRIFRFIGVIAGCWGGCILGAALSPILAKIVKWTIILSVIGEVWYIVFQIV
jgi:hypothetical protein